MGFIFHLPGFDSCEEKGKVGSELMCLFVEKILSFKKSMRPRAKRSLKEPSRDAEVMIAILLGSFFQYRFLPILFKTRCAS